MDDNITDYRISNLEKEVAELKKDNTSTALALTRLELKQDNMINTIQNLTTAIDALKENPVKEFNKGKSTIIVGIILFVINSGITLLITKLS